MSYWFSFLFPWLLVFWILQVMLARRKMSGVITMLGKPVSIWRALLCLAAASTVVVLLPVCGIPLGRWVAGLNFAPSIPLLAFLFDRICKSLFRTDVLRQNDARTGWLFGAAVGTVFYPLSLGLG